MAKVREWLDRHRAQFRRVAHMTETVTLVLVIAMGGAAGGYWFAQWQVRDLVVQLRTDHVAEIERMQATYALTLQALAPKINDIAQTAQQAAGAAAEAAVTSAEVAQAAKKVAQGGTGARPLTEAERARANAAIDAANRKLQEAKQ